MEDETGLVVLGAVLLQLVESVFQVITPLLQHLTKTITDRSEDTDVPCGVFVIYLQLMWQFRSVRCGHIRCSHPHQIRVKRDTLRETIVADAPECLVV